MAAFLQFRQAIRRILPPWLTDRVTLGKTAGFRLLASYAYLLDGAMQHGIEGILSGLPQHAQEDALKFLGRDRRMVRGPLQTVEDFRLQLAEYLDLLRQAGNAWSVARTLQRFLGPGLPMVRVVTRGGFWTTLEADGSVGFHHGGNWDWDSITHPERAGRWWDVWVIMYEPHIPDAAEWGELDADEWGQDSAFGNEVAMAVVRAVRALLDQWKGAHAHVQALIFAYDLDSFPVDGVPGVTPDFPDGLWGHWSKLEGTTQVPTRFEGARYWEDLH